MTKNFVGHKEEKLATAEVLHDMFISSSELEVAKKYRHSLSRQLPTNYWLDVSFNRKKMEMSIKHLTNIQKYWVTPRKHRYIWNWIAVFWYSCSVAHISESQIYNIHRPSSTEMCSQADGSPKHFAGWKVQIQQYVLYIVCRAVTEHKSAVRSL